MKPYFFLEGDSNDRLAEARKLEDGRSTLEVKMLLSSLANTTVSILHASCSMTTWFICCLVHSADRRAGVASPNQQSPSVRPARHHEAVSGFLS